MTEEDRKLLSTILRTWKLEQARMIQSYIFITLLRDLTSKYPEVIQLNERVIRNGFHSYCSYSHDMKSKQSCVKR